MGRAGPSGTRGIACGDEPSIRYGLSRCGVSMVSPCQQAVARLASGNLHEGQRPDWLSLSSCNWPLWQRSPMSTLHEGAMSSNERAQEI